MSGVIQVALSSGLGDYIFGLDPQLFMRFSDYHISNVFCIFASVLSVV